MTILKRYGRPVTQPVSVRITACARLHLGLISMHADGPRKNGGVGFAVEAPAAVVDAQSSDRLIIKDQRRRPFEQSELDQLIHDVELVRLENELAPANITVSGTIQTHVGMGSGTAIRLAILEGLFALSGRPYTPDKLAIQSGRGRTSGIGTRSYFSGGMILDIGRPNDGLPFAPSSQSKERFVPSGTLPSLEMPPWPLCVCVPTNIRPKAQLEEVEFFDRVLPLKAEDSYRSCYEAVFGIYGSVKDRDYGAFCQAVTSMQTTKWKASEWHEYGKELQLLKRKLEQLGVDCVGMSSLGPLLFCFAPPDVLDQLLEVQGSISCDVIRTRPSNVGRALLRHHA